MRNVLRGTRHPHPIQGQRTHRDSSLHITTNSRWQPRMLTSLPINLSSPIPSSSPSDPEDHTCTPGPTMMKRGRRPMTSGKWRSTCNALALSMRREGRAGAKTYAPPPRISPTGPWRADGGSSDMLFTCPWVFVMFVVRIIECGAVRKRWTSCGATARSSAL